MIDEEQGECVSNVFLLQTRSVNNSKDNKTPPGFPADSFTLHCCSHKKWYINFFFSALVYKSRMSVHFSLHNAHIFPPVLFFSCFSILVIYLICSHKKKRHNLSTSSNNMITYCDFFFLIFNESVQPSYGIVQHVLFVFDNKKKYGDF